MELNRQEVIKWWMKIARTTREKLFDSWKTITNSEVIEMDNLTLGEVDEIKRDVHFTSVTNEWYLAEKYLPYPRPGLYVYPNENPSSIRVKIVHNWLEDDEKVVLPSNNQWNAGWEQVILSYNKEVLNLVGSRKLVSRTCKEILYSEENFNKFKKWAIEDRNQQITII